MLAKSMTGEEVAQELISTLSVQYSIPSNCLLAAIKDRASVNGVAMQTLRTVHPMAVDVKRFSHTLNLVGECFKVPLLSEFINSWVSLFVHSPKAQLCWKGRTGIAVRSYCPTIWWSQWEVVKQAMESSIWWSQWEVVKQAMESFGDIVLFLTSNEDFSHAMRTKLLATLSDATNKALLLVEMAAVVDAGEPLVKATYRLEGGGPLSLKCYEIIFSALEGARVANFPNLNAITYQLSAGN